MAAIETSSAGRRGFLERGGAWVVVQAVLMMTVLALGRVGPEGWVRSWTLPLGIGLMAIGAAFGIAGAIVLGRNRTMFPKPNAGSRLIRHGPYRWVRHPLYTSVILLSLAWGMCCGSSAALGAGVVLGLFLRAKASHEERWLLAQFPEYAEYRRQVKCLVPWVY
jgi:protein-S-isoprenylcysteine O-methyltransferase Ste14